MKRPPVLPKPRYVVSAGNDWPIVAAIVCVALLAWLAYLS